MEPALKQRLIGAAVLVAIAVIFLPMLIKGPAPESGVSDVPLEMPNAPEGEFETRELPLVTPAAADGSSVTGLGARPVDPADGGNLPTVDTRAPDTGPADSGTVDAAPAANGNYAVSFGSYASAGDAKRVVEALRNAQLPGYQETTTTGDRTLYRVRVGPYQSRAAAEAGRLGASRVRDDVGSKVVVLNADAAEAEKKPIAATGPVASKPAPPPAEEPIPVASKPAAKPASPEPAATKPVAAAKPADPTPADPTPAASAVGFAVQLGAFASHADATKLRDRARALGLSAFVETVTTDKGPLNRVQVGPVADRAAAEKLRAQAAAKLGITGFVHSHP
ncbi:SPOR domain-containing protein [Lysobacter sp. A421]